MRINRKIDFYLIFFSITIFIGLLGLLTIYMTIHRDLSIILTILGFIYLIGSFVIYIAAFLQVPILELDNSKIVLKSFLKKETIEFTEISNLEFNNKFPFFAILLIQTEGIEISLKSGRKIKLFHNYYENGHVIPMSFKESFLGELDLDNKKPFDTLKKIAENDYDYIYYKGNAFLSFTPLLEFSLIGMLVIGSLINFSQASIPLLLLSIGIFAHTYYMTNYIGLSSNFLVIKHHYFTLNTDYFQLEDIQQVVFETRNKFPNCIRIITKSFKSYLYPAETLRNKQWIILKKELEKKGINVRNECIPEK